jgi:hypothetical protein
VRNKRESFHKRAAVLGIAAVAVILSATAWAADVAPCSANSESRQLDFWLGNWTISVPGFSGNSASKVSLSLDKCLIVESWNDGRGHDGQNTFGYSGDDKSWYGMFADNKGRVHVFTSGTVSGGIAEFNGSSGTNEEKALNRVKIARLSADKVEQTWEKSSDNGHSWKTVFRGEYSRTNP